MLLIKNIETPRLTLRSWHKSDKDFTLSLWGDKENGNYDIGYCISKDHWKEGLGTEVIDAIIRWVKAEGGKSITGEKTCFDAHYYKLNLA